MDFTNVISGLGSGLDWVSIVNQLMTIEHKPVDLMETDKAKVNERYKVWTQVNTKLVSLKSAVAALKQTSDFDSFTSSASVSGSTKTLAELASFAVGSNAAQGSYTLTVDNLAQAQKLSSRSFEATSNALNITGDILVNGHVVTIAASDSLINLRDKINALNTGDNPARITASIFTSATGEYRLTLTSQATGAEGIDLANASSADVLGQLGMADNSVALHNLVTNGAQSSEFESSTESIKTLLGLNTSPSGNVTIAGESISIDLTTDSLQTIRDRINANANLQSQGVSASIVTSTDAGKTTYALQIDGTQTLTDADNILQTLGFLRQGHADVSGVTGDLSNTSGGKKITQDTLIADIDGYNTWTSGDRITIQGTNHSGGAIGPTDFTITQTSTVEDLLNAIESAYGNQVAASVNADGKIVVEDNLSGASSLTLTLTPTIADAHSTLNFGTFGASTIRKREIVSGEDAQITLDGATITRPSNQISDVITGVTLDLKGEDADAVITLNLDRDYNGIKDKIKDVVSKYNDLITSINNQFVYDEKTKTAPPLFGDAALLSVKSDLRSVILSAVDGLTSDLDHLSLIGINIDRNGLLAINDSKLDGYLRTNFSDVVNLFAAQGTSTNSNLTYVESGRKTKAGSYEVEITQAATQANTTGSGFSGALSGDATLSITDSTGRAATISLSAGWNITSIVNAINSELVQEYNEIRVGANRYYGDAGHTTPITASTTWNNVYDASGNTANLANGDVITFSGTTRAGSTVNGSYTIADVSSGTVGDLLNAIEDAFGSGYDASIDNQGRIAIKDKTKGDAELTLTINTVKNLDFGAIDVDPTGADGSKEGRFALGITAANEGGQLKIYNNTYGDSSFTISVTGGNLGMTNGTYTGADVAGRIRMEGSSTWMAMTGDGQTLTGDADQDVEGLIVKYTGTSSGTYNFDYTTGVGEKLDQALFYMTDPYEGYVANKQTALKKSMDNFDLKIAEAERRLEKRQEILVNQFVVMEKLLSGLMAQQQWLTGQINSLGA